MCAASLVSTVDAASVGYWEFETWEADHENGKS